MNATSPRYVKPKKATNFFNESVGRLTRLGISVYGSRVLYVRGRKSGEWRSNPVNPLTVDGTGELRIGRRVEPFRATEIADDDKPPVLRAYLKRWKWEVGVFFDGVDAKASDETLRGIAPGYPIFRIEPAAVTR
jgi:hypothetical protein